MQKKVSWGGSYKILKARELKVRVVGPFEHFGRGKKGAARGTTYFFEKKVLKKTLRERRQKGGTISTAEEGRKERKKIRGFPKGKKEGE